MTINEFWAAIANNADFILGNVYDAILLGAVLFGLSKLLMNGVWKCDGCDDMCGNDEPSTPGIDGKLYCAPCTAGKIVPCEDTLK